MANDTPHIDVQVNGYAGCDFNDPDSSPDAWQVACERLQADGIQKFLVAIITADLDVMSERLRHVVEMRSCLPIMKSMLWGIHIEGPFINPTPGFVGAHRSQSTRIADVDIMQRLLDAADGLTQLVTLAPERDRNYKTVKHLAQQGITVAAGHCDPTLEQLQRAIDAGLTMFTHLGNGCPMLLHRHDNIIQRVLSLSDRLWITFIADGIHIPFVALKNYFKCASLSRCIVTTDAMAAAGMGPGKYRLGSNLVDVSSDLAVWAGDGSHLIGSALTMPFVAKNLREQLGLSCAEIKQLTYSNPLAAIGTGSSEMVNITSNSK